jgi:hypothetical protein
VPGISYPQNTAAVAIGPFTKDDYPLQERLRPMVLPDRMGEVGLDLSYANVAGADFALVQPSFSYGIADVVDVGISSSLLLSPDVAWGRDVMLQAHYLAVDTKELDFAPGLVLPLVFAEGAEPNTVSYSADDAEFEKQLATRIEPGDRVVVVDNAKTHRPIQSCRGPLTLAPSWSTRPRRRASSTGWRERSRRRCSQGRDADRGAHSAGRSGEVRARSSGPRDLGVR